MGKDLFVAPVLQLTGVLVAENAFDLHVLLDDVVDVTVEEVGGVGVTGVRKFAMVQF